MDKRIIVALDFPNTPRAEKLLEDLKDLPLKYKVGMELNTAGGTQAVVNEVGARNTFLDLKFHDISNTVAGAARAAASRNFWMFNLHTSGGIEMMKAAVQSRNEVQSAIGHRARILGVTVLTSLDAKALEALGIYNETPLSEKVRLLALAALESGLDGVVCSPQEIKIVREAIPDENFLIVTPGIRDNNAPPDDQKRTMTAREAIDAGATHLVIGRPITQAPEPKEAAQKFLKEIA